MRLARSRPSFSVLICLLLVSPISLGLIKVALINAAPPTQGEKPTYVLAFLPINWAGTLEEFDQAVDKRADLFIEASGIEDYARVEIKVIHDILWGDPDNSQLHAEVVRFGAKREAADVYIGLMDNDVRPSGSVGGWTTFGGNGVIAEASYPLIVAHELGHVFYLCDEYNYTKWKQQDDKLTVRGGCPNPYPEDCEKCDVRAGACCPGQFATKDGYCIMGPTQPESYAYGPACSSHLEQIFAETFSLPPDPTALPETATATLAAKPIASVTRTPSPLSPTATIIPTSTASPISFSFSALVEVDNRLQLMVVDSVGTENLAAVPVEGNIYAAAWEPGGKRAVLSVGYETNLDLYLWEAASGHLTRLTQTPANEAGPTWHPNEEEILFVSDEAGNYELYTLDLVTELRTRLTDSPGNEHSPAVSPDARFLSYSYELDGHSSLALHEVETGTVTYLDLGVEAFHPAWSLNGRQLAFTGVYEGDWDIGVWHVTTGRLERLTYGGGPQLTPAWLPDDRLLFQAFQDGLWTIYLMNPDGTQWEQVAHVASNVRDPAFAK